MIIILNNNTKNKHKIKMQQRLQFYPDIQTKYDHLISHMNDKNQVTTQLVKILKDVCNLELFYSNSLDKFANSISKLFLGKDPLKDALVVLQRIISSKSQQSQKLAKQIKDDLIPHIEKSINVKIQQQMREKQNDVRNIRASMQRKIRMLFANQAIFKKSVQEINSLPKIMSVFQKEKALQSYRKKQDQFSDTIDSYNSSLNEYMIKYSQICQQFLKNEANRLNQYKDAITKLILFEIDYIKNLQYNFRRYSTSLQKQEGKLLIQDQGLDFGDPFYQTKQSGIIHLGKISNKNYIDNIIGKKKVNENLLSQQIKITQLKVKYQPGMITRQVYHDLVKTILPILNFIQRNNHTNLLIQVVFLTKDLYTAKGNFKISLLNAVLCHQLFFDQKFWQSYEKRLLQKISRQENLTAGDEKILQQNCSNVLDRDLVMLQNVEVNPSITKVIKSICERAKFIVQPIGYNPIQTNINGQQNGTITNNQHLISSTIKYKIFQ